MVRYYRSVLGDLGIDGRTARGRDLLKLQNKLIAYVGGRPSPVEMLWIERALLARKWLYNLDDRVQAGARWTPDDLRTYALFDGSFHKALAGLVQSQRSVHRQNPKVLSLLDLIGHHKARG